MLTYKYKLYKAKRNRCLDALLQEACFVWNRFLAIQKRYYTLFGKYASANALKKHFAKRYKRTYLHSQSAQEVIERLDPSYKRFFKHLAKRPPKFKRPFNFTSVVYKSGFKLDGNCVTINSLHNTFKFHQSRQIQGSIKRVSIKRSALGEYYIIVITDHAINNTNIKSRHGASVGIDFGLKSYLTLSDGTKVENPQFYKYYLRKLQRASKLLSKKQRGSQNRKKARRALCDLHERVVNCCTDFQWKLANELCRRYDLICIENLSLVGMSKLWGRKIHDLSHGTFVDKLMYVATKYGCVVHNYPSSKLRECGYKNDSLHISDREWVCPHCGHTHDRDINAANNILRRGIYELESGSKTNVTSATKQPR